jgi:glycosyltransferase involved in cell wall biosynthesis
MARLSATLIVRDESAFIEECLDSLAGVVDEIVLVDTGSRDDTIDIALNFPIKLHHFRWCDNFSSARNYAIEQATGDWILYIDADERFKAPDQEALQHILDDQTKVAWTLRLYPRVNWTPYAELRLFRNDPALRFKGVIHESIGHAVASVCARDRRDIGHCRLELHHVGYEGDQRHKIPRNVPLLRAYLDREPDRIYCWWHLGESLRLAGDDQGAMDAWTRGVAMVRARDRPALDLGDSLAHLSLIKLQWARGMPIANLLDEALDFFPGHLALQWIWAKLCIEGGGYARAKSVLERLAAIEPESYFDPKIAYDKALFRHLSREALALCHYRAGSFSEAAHYYRLAAAGSSDPHACEIKARLAEAQAADRRASAP